MYDELTPQADKYRKKNKTKIMETHSAKHLTIKSGVVVSGRNGGLKMCAAAWWKQLCR